MPTPEVSQAWGHAIPDPHVPSAGVPSAPRSVISNVNETSLVLEWSEPQDTGGRDDLLYNVICKKCSVERRLCTRCDDNVEFVPRQLGLTERRIYISNLMAHTQYTFEIQAVNGISNKSPYPPHFASVNITTNQAGQWNCWRAGADSPLQSGAGISCCDSLGGCSPLCCCVTGSPCLHLIPWVNSPLRLTHVPGGHEIRTHASGEGQGWQMLQRAVDLLDLPQRCYACCEGRRKEMRFLPCGPVKAQHQLRPSQPAERSAVPSFLPLWPSSSVLVISSHRTLI